MKKFLLIIIYLLFLSIAYSQTLQDDLKFDRLTASDGLPDNNVSNIFQDHLGFLWISTTSGLVRYDGYNFKMIKFPGDSLSFTGNMVVRVITEDIEGNIWAGTRRKGMVKYTRETESLQKFSLSKNDSSLIYNDIVISLFVDSSNVLWIGTAAGLNKWDLKTEKKNIFQYDSLNDNSISSNVVNEIDQDKEGNLWIATNYGLNKFNPEKNKWTRHITKKKVNGWGGNAIASVAIDEQGYLWIASFKYGLRKFYPNLNKFIDYLPNPQNPDSLPSNFITNILRSSDGNLWLSAPRTGLIKFITKEKRFITYTHDSDNPNSISSDFVYPLIEDQTGIIWISSAMSGICKLDKYNHKFSHIIKEPNIKNTLSSNRILSLEEDSFGKLWIGTDGKGLDCYDKKTGKWKNYIYGSENNKTINLEYVLCIYEDKNKTIWCGTDGAGLYKYVRKTDNFRKYTFGKYEYHNRIDDIFEDSNGNLWLCFSGDGLKKFNRQNGEFVTFYHKTEDSLSISSSYVYKILQDSSGYLWLGTRQGLNRFDPDQEAFNRYFIKDKKSSILTNLFLDRNDDIWVISIRDGLFKFDKNERTFTSFRNTESFQLNKIKGILEDSRGNLWIGNNVGIAKFNTGTKTFYNYTEKDGLLKGLINEGAFLKDSRGNMYFGGNRGISYFNPEEIIDNTTPPPIYFTHMKFWDSDKNKFEKKNIVLSDITELDYWQNDISFDFAALQFSRPEKNQYAFKLENYMDDFRYIGENHSADFTNLPPGNYRLTVKAANSDGYWNEKSKVFTIIIHPPFWETWIFRFFILLLIILAIYTWHKKRVKKIEQRKQELEERIIEKTEAAEALNKALGQVETLKDRLQAENTYLQAEINLDHNFSELISRSKIIKKVLNRVEQVSSTDSTVLILGESGTGKELIARAVHNLSARRDRPLVKVNCAALPTGLIESELFGHEKGAFTGATVKKTGKFELANGGTIFLDEIGELPLELQSKLLRVIQEKEFEKLGGHTTQKIDVRIIAATNRKLDMEVKEGKFREDLFFRLNVFPVTLPPLRDRKEDISLLVNHFVKKYSAKIGKTINKIPQAVIDDFNHYHWPGNVRELENVIERAVIISPGTKLIVDEQMIRFDKQAETDGEITHLTENEKQHIIKALQHTNWRVSGDKGAAKILGINPQTLVSRMKKLGIEAPSGKK